MITLLVVAAAGAIGAPSRYVVDQLVDRWTKDRFPWGTFVINTGGAFLLGLVTGLALRHGVGRLPAAIVGSGFCGAFTTFSTFSYETLQLLEEGTIRAAVGNVVGSLAFGLLAAGAGLAIAAAT